MTIALRGEHLINLYRYLREPSYRLRLGPAQGYSESFARRHDELMQRLIDNPDQAVKVIAGCDDLCQNPPCPKHSESCELESLKIKDRQTARLFSLELDIPYSAGELLNQLRKVPPSQVPH